MGKARLHTRWYYCKSIEPNWGTVAAGQEIVDGTVKWIIRDVRLARNADTVDGKHASYFATTVELDEKMEDRYWIWN